MTALVERMAAVKAAGPVYVWASGMTDWGRDGDLWPVLLDALRRRYVHAPATVWSAGCATGEEPYTLAMRTAGWPHPPRIVATDVRRDALAVARRGRYPAASCRPPYLPADLAEHLAPGDRWATVRPSARQRVEFFGHDLLSGQPATRSADVVLMRNVLHMLDPEQVPAALAAAGRALADGGQLAVGLSDLQVTAVRSALDRWGQPDGHRMLYRPR